MALPKQIEIEVVTATDLSPKYLQCASEFIRFWLLIGRDSEYLFRPKVFVVCKSIPDSLDTVSEYCQVVSLDHVHSAFTAQNIRTIEAGNSLADFVVTTDIDMFPLSLQSFTPAIEALSRDNDLFVVLRDVLEPGQYPICYNVASPDTWKTVMLDGEDIALEDRLLQLLDRYGGKAAYDGIHGGDGWHIDQMDLYKRVSQNIDSNRLITFTDAITKHRRLDRAHHRFPLNWLILPLVVFGYFSDYHVHHPIHRYRRYIKALYSALRIRMAFPALNNRGHKRDKK